MNRPDMAGFEEMNIIETLTSIMVDLDIVDDFYYSIEIDYALAKHFKVEGYYEGY